MRTIRRTILIALAATILWLVPGRLGAVGLRDETVLAKQTQTIKDADGEVKVTMEWFQRPGEMALGIEYFGYLIQEGTVNFYLDLNGTRREFSTLRTTLPNRAQKIRFVSFHPSVNDGGVNKLKPLPPSDLVDYLLFQNAAYYPQFGKNRIELKFFAHGRWDGDGNHGNANYVFEFESPVAEKAQDHF